jgi:hypothetical protein
MEMHGKCRGNETEYQQDENWFIKRGFYPLPLPIPTLIKQKCDQCNKGYKMYGAYCPAMYRAPGKGGEDE